MLENWIFCAQKPNNIHRRVFYIEWNKMKHKTCQTGIVVSLFPVSFTQIVCMPIGLLYARLRWNFKMEISESKTKNTLSKFKVFCWMNWSQCFFFNSLYYSISIQTFVADNTQISLYWMTSVSFFWIGQLSELKDRTVNVMLFFFIQFVSMFWLISWISCERR